MGHQGRALPPCVLCAKTAHRLSWDFACFPREEGDPLKKTSGPINVSLRRDSHWAVSDTQTRPDAARRDALDLLSSHVCRPVGFLLMVPLFSESTVILTALYR